MFEFFSFYLSKSRPIYIYMQTNPSLALYEDFLEHNTNKGKIYEIHFNLMVFKNVFFFFLLATQFKSWEEVGD